MTHTKRYIAASIGITVLTCAAIVLSACAVNQDGTFLIDHDNDPNTAPMEMTKDQRCTWYDTRIDMIDAKEPPLNDYDTYARTGYATGRAMAACPVVEAE
jgi:hypothetical protein